MELSRVKILVDKYFDGLTSLDEEQELARYFAKNSDIPEEYQAVKMMFASFDTLRADTPKEKVEVKRRKAFTISRRWIAGVAAVAAILIGITVAITPTEDSIDMPVQTEPDYVCYVGGVKIEDDQLAYAEASRLLSVVSEDMQSAMAEINRLTYYNIVK